MKVILVGATGFVGGAVLDEALAHPSITTIYALSRRPLKQEHRKLHTIIHADLSKYSDEVLAQLAGAEACIWCVGGKVNDFPSAEVARHVSVDLPVAFAQACATHVVPTLGPEARPFRFVVCSGFGAERDPTRSLLIAGDTRRFKGEMETKLLEVAQAQQSQGGAAAAATTTDTETETPVMQLTIVRPGGIMQKGQSKGLVGRAAIRVLPAVVGIEILATCMVALAVRRTPGKEVYENPDILNWPTGSDV